MTSAPKSPDAKSGGSRRALLLLVLILAPAALRLWPIGHGAPRPDYVPDTHYVRNALAMASTKNLIPKANEFSSYPFLIPYVLLPVYGAEFARGKIAGDWSNTEAFGNELLENPWRAHRLARFVTALISSTAALFIFLAARAAGLGVGAWIAAWLAATCLLHVQLSLHERPWAPLTAMMAMTAWLSAVHVKTGTKRSLMGAGLASAAAFCMNPAGGGALLMAGVAWALAPNAPGETSASDALRRRILAGFQCVALFATVSLVVGFPFYLRYGLDAGSTAANDYLRDGQQQLALGGQQMILEFRAATFTGLTKKFIGYDPVILALGLAGLIAALRRRPLVPAAAFVLAWGALFMTNQNEHVRYILPMALLMTLPAGIAAEWLSRSVAGKVALAVLLALPLVQALRLGYVMRQPDTRAIAEELLAELPASSVIAVDLYGPTPPQTAETLETTMRLRERVGGSLYRREAHRLGELMAGHEQPSGLPVVRLQDVFEYDLRYGGTWVREAPPRADESKETLLPPIELGDTAQSALAAIGATHLLLTDRTPDDGVRPPLVDPTPPRPFGGDGDPNPKLDVLALPADPLWTVHPAWAVATATEDAAPVPDAHLPTALTFPLRDLWRVRRPGPKLELYSLQ